MAFLLIVLLAQNDFVTFDICRVDFRANPPEARHAFDEPPLDLRPGVVAGFQPLPRHYAGIKCVRISDGVRMIFVVGSADEIRAKLKGK